MQKFNAFGDPLSPSRAAASIWAIPAAVLALTAALLALAGYQEYRDTLETEFQFLDAHARMGQIRLEELVRDVHGLLDRVVEELPARTPSRKAYGERLALLREAMPEIQTLAVVDARGRVEVSSRPGLVGFDGSRREYFTAHRENPSSGFHISRPFKSVYGDYAISFSLPIRDPQAKLLDIVVAGVHYGYFAGVMKEIRPDQTHTATAILNVDGYQLYRLPNPESNVGRYIARNAVFQTFLRNGRQTTRGIARSTGDDVERLYVMRTVAGTDLNVSTSRPVDDVLAPWRRAMALRAGFFLLGAAVVVGLTLAALRRQREAMASREFLSGLIESANALVIGIDERSRIVLANCATENLSGYPRAELLGRSIFETLMPRECFPQAWKAFEDYRQTRRAPHSMEAPILTRDGAERIIAWQSSGSFVHGGQRAMLAFGIDVTERAELQRARSREEISRRLVHLQEEERRRLAVELHERTSPNLTALDINLKLLAGLLPKDASPELSGLIQDISATLSDTVASIRAVSIDFRPPLLDYSGLWPALNAYARQFSKRTGISVKINEPEAPPRLLPEVETNLFHIVQEALANCAMHSHAETVMIRQTSQGADLILMVCDDGVGFGMDAHHRGTGLATMRQRAAFIGGSLHVDSHPGKGCCVAVRFPVGAAAPYCKVLPAEPPNQEAAPDPAALPLEKQAVSR